MILRTINAWLSLVTTVLFLNHAIFHAAWMLSKGNIAKNASNMSFVLFGLMMFHAIISIVLGILGHKNAEKRKCNGYFNLNKTTYIQRASGVALIVLTALHIAGTIGILQPPRFSHQRL